MILKLHPQFKLNAHQFKTTDELVSFAKKINDEVYEFLTDWFNKSPFIEVTTSGSTGNPKEIKLKKEYMINSANATGKYFNLFENTTALLCMSPKYIAGKMMLVRAMVLGWELDIVDAESNPLKNIDKNYDFCAMVPLQVALSISELYKIKTVIVGGGTVSNSLKASIQNLKTNVYATYGMTEAITHIAVQKLNNNPTAYFECLPHIKVTKDVRNCLVIEASQIADEKIITNDLIEIKNETSFKWLGRFDNVINSGGVKLFPEQIEMKLAEIIENKFFIASVPDELLGEKVVLIMESSPFTYIDLQTMKAKMELVLSSYEVPKLIYFTPNFVETSTKKIQRLKTLDLIFNQPKN